MANKKRGYIYGTHEKRTELSDRRISGWTELMIKKWHAKIRSLDIHNRGMLEQSFSKELVWEPRGANEIEYLKAIVFKFFDYGRFVDYGLGRGTNLARRFKRGSKAEDNPRKRKEWIREPWTEHRIELVPLVQFRARREIVNYFLQTAFREDVDTHFHSKLEK